MAFRQVKTVVPSVEEQNLLVKNELGPKGREYWFTNCHPKHVWIYKTQVDFAHTTGKSVSWIFYDGDREQILKQFI